MRVTPIPIFGAKCKRKPIKRDKLTSYDFVAHGRPLRGQKGSLRSPRGQLIASLVAEVKICSSVSYGIKTLPLILEIAQEFWP